MCVAHVYILPTTENARPLEDGCMSVHHSAQYVYWCGAPTTGVGTLVHMHLCTRTCTCMHIDLPMDPKTPLIQPPTHLHTPLIHPTPTPPHTGPSSMLTQAWKMFEGQHPFHNYTRRALYRPRARRWEKKSKNQASESEEEESDQDIVDHDVDQDAGFDEHTDDAQPSTSSSSNNQRM